MQEYINKNHDKRIPGGILRLLTKSAQKLRKLNIETVEKSTVFLYF